MFDSNTQIDLFGLSGRGGVVHRQIQDNLVENLTKLYPDKIVKAEGKIDLGNGKYRFGDVVVYNGDKIIQVHQVGDMRTQGNYFRPSSRERGAIEDIRQVLGNDTDIIFHDKKQRATLLNPDKQDKWKSPRKKHRKLKTSCK